MTLRDRTAAALRAARLDSGIARAAVAAAAGVHPTQLSTIENARHNPTLHMVDRVAGAVGHTATLTLTVEAHPGATASTPLAGIGDTRAGRVTLDDVDALTTALGPAVTATITLGPAL